jgi:hypothetical protein
MTPDKPVSAPEPRHLFDDPRSVQRVIRILCGICLVLFIADAFVPRHVDHPWERLFGFYGIFGFVAFVALVLTAKELRRILMRKATYYDD